MPQMTNDDGLLTFGPVPIKNAEALVYQLELDGGFLGTAPSIHEVRGVIDAH